MQQRRPRRITRNECPLCLAHHPAEEGITFYTRDFLCPRCGTEWEDVWCADCNDKCPTCNAEIEPLPEPWSSEVFEKPIQLSSLR